MKCKDFTANIDLHKRPESFSGYVEYYRHLVLCTFCREYIKLSLKLSRALRFVSEENENHQTSLDIEKLNKILLDKYKSM